MRFQVYLNEDHMLYSKDGIKVFDTQHAIERIIQRNELKPDQLKHLFDIIIDQLKTMKSYASEFKDTLLFYSKSLHQGVVAAWDKTKNAIRLITFLPRNHHFAKPDTTEVVVEGTSMTLTVIYVD
jgi:hypothetical protein